MSNLCELVQEVFRLSYTRKASRSNPLRSATFVSLLADRLKDLTPGTSVERLVQHVNERGEKEKGEWLLDIAVVETSEEKWPYKYSRDKAGVYFNKILWAVESEFHTGLTHFLEDFAKLIHVNANNFLYINGLNQPELSRRSEYIRDRTEIARRLIRRAKKTEFYLGFVPSPRRPPRQKEGSLWDNHDLEQLLKWIKVDKIA